MSLFDRRTFLALTLALGACGFQPAYGPAGPAAGLRGSIEVDAPNTENGFHLVRRFEQRLGQPANARFGLAYDLTLSEDDLAITKAQDINRYNVLGRIDYALREMASGAVVHSGRVENFASYSATGSTVGTATAKSAAYERLMIMLADQITTRLIATAAGWQK